MRVYLAGPITGVPDYRRRFADAAQAVAAAGHEPVSPTDAVPPADGSWEGWMRATTSLLTTTDGVALLPGWETSRGARIEHDWAASVGLPARPLAAWTASGGGAPVPHPASPHPRLAGPRRRRLRRPPHRVGQPRPRPQARRRVGGDHGAGRRAPRRDGNAP